MIGQSVILQDIIDKVTGKAKYAGDYQLPGMLHMKLKFADRPHAQIQSIHIEKAVNAPGVISVLTAEDIPYNRYGLIISDQPVLCDKTVRFTGDQIAAVVANTPQQASQAAALITVIYQDLPIISTPEQALSPDAPPLHSKYPDNIAHKIRLRRGNTTAVLEKAAVVFEKTYHTPVQEHAYLEPEAGVAYPGDDGEIIIRSAGQSVFDDQRQIAKALGKAPENIRVIYGVVGGAFGGREDISVQIVLALAAWKLGQPVKLVWDRKESIQGHGKRHAMTIRHRWSADPDGKITAAEIEIIADAGAYMYTSSSVLEGLLSSCVGPYDIPNVKLDGKAVFTNNIPGAAFRGYGTPQTGFAAELHLSQIAELLSIDPITIRERNCLKDNSRLPTGTTLPGSSSLPELIELCAKKAGYRKIKDSWRISSKKDAGVQLHGVGFALGMKATGYGYGIPEGSQAKIILHGGKNIDSVELYTSTVDIGQGSNTVLVQIAAHVLDIPEHLIQIYSADTGLCADGGATAASRITFFAGNAIKLSAEKALEAWQNENRPAVGEARWNAPLTTAPDPSTGACIDNVSYSFSAQSLFITVDQDTGQATVEKVIAVQDVGKAINAQKIEGQIEGAVVQALGWSLMENFSTKNGKVLSNTLGTYLIPTVLDTPTSLDCVLVENPDPNGPFGARGVGEIPFIPLAPAILSAIKDATGTWFSHLPLLTEEILDGIKERG